MTHLLGDPPNLTSALASAHEKFYGESDKAYRALVEAGRKDGNYPFTPQQYAAVHVAGLNAVLTPPWRSSAARARACWRPSSSSRRARKA